VSNVVTLSHCVTNMSADRCTFCYKVNVLCFVKLVLPLPFDTFNLKEIHHFTLGPTLFILRLAMKACLYPIRNAPPYNVRLYSTLLFYM